MRRRMVRAAARSSSRPAARSVRAPFLGFAGFGGQAVVLLGEPVEALTQIVAAKVVPLAAEPEPHASRRPWASSRSRQIPRAHVGDRCGY
ncbi:hypothetical protein TR51_35445 [Kitasatospora griseola]|uniref:Uncharacterized protein n=1 Tax=Kitasatospora griseola TaxID=2064 RepID=A0A0D0PGF6_KITGR|nr:hypothetical protein TR51_35445 [Kitasatospora griseola]